ncbi:ricin-type beta-trefoil lectin protein [Saccharothrix carnea]|uniref:Ricin-type beta-trefoil lectin protein n=1 Tax=Saccharothrix carnea TaxID=1280637 RepID=A0A2P8HZX2_SACCR|nr:RICIN domain-containing protein [Saccharothrix carnea]PSL51782.1 ricin-type beta-trefoil lectin protein [Saccharothrix carnea]
MGAPEQPVVTRWKRPPGIRRGLIAAGAVAALAVTLAAWPNVAPADAAVSAGTYTVKNGGSGQCLDAPSPTSGVQLRQEACAAGADQEWTLTAVSGGYRITSAAGGLCVGVRDASTSAGKPIQLETCTGATSQTWAVTASGSNYRVVNANGGKCMNIQDNSTSAGALVQQNSCDSAATKQWTFTPVSGGPTSTTTSTTTTTTSTTTTTTTTTTTNPPSSALYVSPNGTDSAAGTESAPTTLTSAISRITPGGTILMRGGTYRFAQTVTIPQGNNGTSGDRTELFAHPGETPVLNFSAQTEDPANRGLAVNGNYWHVKGLVVERAGDNGIFVGGSNNIFERTVTRFNRDTGLQLSRMLSTTPKDQWPANNLILSAESHDNADSDGEDADGFAAKLTSGPGNVFRYAVAHNNIDDGWDLYTKTDTGPIGAVTIEDSLAYKNGTLSNGGQAGNGDRNGYKLGGEDIGVNHVIRRNIAYDNGKHGLTYNRNLGSMTISNNLSIDNDERNYTFDGGSSVFRNNTSCRSSSGTNDRIVGNSDTSNQFWTGTNGSRCASYSGALAWSYASDGRLVVTLGGKLVAL